AAAAQGEGSDRGQNRLRKALDGAGYVLSVPAHAHTRDGIHPGELADVRAGDERLRARAGEDDAAHLGVVAERGEGLADLADDVRVQGVQLLLAIDGDGGDIAVPFDTDVGKLGHAGPSSRLRLGCMAATGRAAGPRVDRRRNPPT